MKRHLVKNSKVSYTQPTYGNEGEIISLSDGIVWMSGLGNAMYGEVINFKYGISGLILNLEENKVGAVVLGDYQKLQRGDKGISSGKLFQIGVGEEILGRVIDPLGNELDEKGPIAVKENMLVEKIAPGIIDRKPIGVPLQTGIKAIDAMIPIGRGQRELIIGDRGTGKTALALDTMINQKDSDVVSIYVSIGQKQAKTAQILGKLTEFGVIDKCVVVDASASSSAAVRYLAPYVGCAIGEYFMGKGKHALVIYDDLTKHAWAYRELSLLLKRPTGREAYPGDVFYLHSRLLERACQLSDDMGGGSLTALPIIETQAQDVSAYIPTNVISITDGQIYLEPDLFFAGIRPALNVGLSVSRVGGAAQVKAMKKVAGRLRLDLSQYYELATFAQFSTDLDTATKEKIERGKRIVEILKQEQYTPMKVEEQICVIYLATTGVLDSIPPPLVRDFENQFLAYLGKDGSKVIANLSKTKELTKEVEEALVDLIGKFKIDFMNLNNLGK